MGMIRKVFKTIAQAWSDAREWDQLLEKIGPLKSVTPEEARRILHGGRVKICADCYRCGARGTLCENMNPQTEADDCDLFTSLERIIDETF